MNKALSLPKYNDFFWPTLLALRAVGGSARIAELTEQTAIVMKMAEGQLSLPHGESNMTEFEYRCAWARTNLKYIGAIENSERGVWSLTAYGRSLSNENEARRKLREHYKAYRDNKNSIPQVDAQPVLENQNNTEVAIELEWKEKLLGILRTISPDAFERLCQRLLRESNFEDVEVIGRSGDGGIDGVGILKMNLLSFRVVFQSKRHSETVQPNVVRDFRGGMVGRADKGLIITTGRFTLGARKEAVRDGAPAIDLIDGERLCDLLKTLKIGVTTRMVEAVEIDESFFRAT